MEVSTDLSMIPKEQLRILRQRIIKNIEQTEDKQKNLKQEKEESINQLRNVNRALGRTTKVINTVKVKEIEIAEVENKQAELSVTDHALVQYLSRVRGEDMDGLRELIMASIPNEVLNNKYELVEIDGIEYRLDFSRGRATVVTVIKGFEK